MPPVSRSHVPACSGQNLVVDAEVEAVGGGVAADAESRRSRGGGSRGRRRRQAERSRFGEHVDERMVRRLMASRDVATRSIWHRNCQISAVGQSVTSR